MSLALLIQIVCMHAIICSWIHTTNRRFLHNPFFSCALTDARTWKFVASPPGSLSYIMNRVILDGIHDVQKERGKQIAMTRLSSMQKVAMLTQAPFGLKKPTQRHLSSQMSSPAQAQSAGCLPAPVRDCSIVLFCRREQQDMIAIACLVMASWIN